MPDSQYLAPVFSACTDIANQAADSNGFISVRRLLERFGTNLRLRPLLVEGMIGSVNSLNGKPTQWTVLVDSERFPNVGALIETESAAKPLPAHFRFVVAHELAHSMAFRTGEFGVKLEGISDKVKDSALVEEIERETDRLAPLLLCGEQFLEEQLRGLKEPIGIAFLTKLRQECGLSREVLVNRLTLSRAMDRAGLWQRPHLREFGLTIGEWNKSGNAVIRRWPTFLNFSRLVPMGLLKVTQQDKLPFEIAFGEAGLVAIKNGSEAQVTATVGTAATPDAGQTSIEISAEAVESAPESMFLVLTSNAQIRAEVENFEKVRKNSRGRKQRPEG